MKRGILFLMALSLAATTAFAAPSDQRMGLGANAQGDLALSIGMTDGKVLGFGLSFLNQGKRSDNGESATNFGAFVSFDFPIAEGDRASLNIQPRLGFASRNNRYGGFSSAPGSVALAEEGDEYKSTVITPAVGLNARVWVGNNFSLSAIAGLGAEITSYKLDGRDSTTDFGTFANNITEFTFTYWLDKK